MVKRGEQRGADVDIEGADVLVAGGRGLGNAEGFELCEELAAAFGGNSAVAATRAVVDAGWYPYAAQIGQTGKTVSPKLYLAAGISGAIQHKVGMQSLGEHRRDQQGRERADLRVLRPRDRRRPEQDPPEAHRGGQGQEGRPERVARTSGIRAAGRHRRPTRRRSTPQGVRQARPRRRGRADRGRRRDRRRRAPRGSPARTGCCSCSRTTPRRWSGSARCRSP